MKHFWPTHSVGDVFLPVAPFTHVYGLLQGVLVPLSACGESVIPERFRLEPIVELLATYRVSFIGGGPPAIYAGVLAAGNLSSADLSALRVYAAGGAPFPSNEWSGGGTPPGARFTGATAGLRHVRNRAVPARAKGSMRVRFSLTVRLGWLAISARPKCEW
jgi:acyl-CoA synthetase (AMP-forming)/AMP-acid ligase II